MRDMVHDLAIYACGISGFNFAQLDLVALYLESYALCNSCSYQYT